MILLTRQERFYRSFIDHCLMTTGQFELAIYTFTRNTFPSRIAFSQEIHGHVSLIDL